MGNYRFICSHCGKSFESSASEVKECPFCFWSSSVKREDELAVKRTVIIPDGWKEDGDWKILTPSILRSRFYSRLRCVGSVGYFGYLGYRTMGPESEKDRIFFFGSGGKRGNFKSGERSS